MGQITKQQFLSDLSLIWSNAELYNGKDHYIAKNAKELEEIVQKMLKGNLVCKPSLIVPNFF